MGTGWRASALALLAIAAADAPGFDTWLTGMRARAVAAGIGVATVERELAGLAPDARVVALDRRQPGGGARPDFARYLAEHADPGRTGRGAARAGRLAGPLEAARARFGVPPSVVLAVWGAETDYGAVAGGFDVVRSLATLAWDGRRAALFEGELIAALALIDRGRVARGQLKGSWAGATGGPQFLPSRVEADGADGDGDGRADIWGNEADQLASIARYLAARGWRAGEPAALAVGVPAGLDRARVRALTAPATCARPLALHSRWLSMGEWRALGVTGGGALADGTLATLVEPDGPGGAAYLTFGNYRALLAYNCSNLYALSVVELARRIEAGTPPG